MVIHAGPEKQQMPVETALEADPEQPAEVPAAA
jgi:hypothetical protein